MTKDDKQFLVGLIGRQDQKLTNLIGRQDQKFTNLIGRQDQKFTGLFKGLAEKIDGVEIRLEEKIRHNGVMIERLQDLIQSVAENTLGIDRRLTHVEKVLKV